MGFQSGGSSNFKNFKTKWHLGVAPMASHKEYCKGESDGFPKVRSMVSFVGPCMLVAHSCTKSVSAMHWPTCCSSIWIIEPLVTRHSPHLETSTHPFYPNVLRIRKCAPIPSSFNVFTSNSYLSLSRNLKVRQFFCIKWITCSLWCNHDLFFEWIIYHYYSLWCGKGTPCWCLNIKNHHFLSFII